MATQAPIPTPAPTPVETPKETFYYEDSVKTSLDYRIDDIDGQSVRSWFKDEFGAKKTIEFAPKLKSENGHAKGKITVEPKDKALVFSEEVELQSTVDSKPMQFKIKSKELSGHFDMGNIAVGDHWLNPYVGVKIPRAASCLKGQGMTTFGWLFHHKKGAQSRFRGHFEMSFTQNSEECKKPEINAKANASFAWNRFVFSIYEIWNLTHQYNSDLKFSVAGTYKKASGFAQLELKNYKVPTFWSAGLNYKVCSNLGLYAQANHDLDQLEKKKPTFDFGVDYTHCSGLNTKAAFDLTGKLWTAFNFNVNKNVSGSLLFDTNVRTHDCKECAWGAKVKVNL